MRIFCGSGMNAMRRCSKREKTELLPTLLTANPALELLCKDVSQRCQFSFGFKPLGRCSSSIQGICSSGGDVCTPTGLSLA